MDELKQLATKTFKSHVRKETLYGVVDDYGEVENKMTLYRVGNYLFIEWVVGDEIAVCEMGISTDGKMVTEIDGVFEPPIQALELLEEYDLNVSGLKLCEHCGDPLVEHTADDRCGV